MSIFYFLLLSGLQVDDVYLIMARADTKSALTLGSLYCAWAHLTPKVHFVWLVWALRSDMRSRSFAPLLLFGMEAESGGVLTANI